MTPIKQEERVIKFRAWDENYNKMVYFGFEDLRGAGYGKDKILYIDKKPFDDEYKSIHEDKIMQYTGLKDKNGKEIYEGDIISRKFLLNIASDPMEKVEEVVWMDKVTGFYPFAYVNIEPDVIEIIGNIYENPQLLKEEQTQ